MPPFIWEETSSPVSGPDSTRPSTEICTFPSGASYAVTLNGGVASTTRCRSQVSLSLVAAAGACRASSGIWMKRRCLLFGTRSPVMDPFPGILKRATPVSSSRPSNIRSPEPLVSRLWSDRNERTSGVLCNAATSAAEACSRISISLVLPAAGPSLKAADPCTYSPCSGNLVAKPAARRRSREIASCSSAVGSTADSTSADDELEVRPGPIFTRGRSRTPRNERA